MLSSCQPTDQKAEIPFTPLPESSPNVARSDQISYLTRLINEQDVTNPQWHLKRGLLHLENQKENLAIPDLEVALRADSTNGVLQLALAQAYMLKRDSVQAFARARKAEELGESVPELWQLLARLTYHQEKYQQAIRYWERFQEVFSEDPEAFFMAGKAFRHLGDTAEAMYRYRQALCYTQKDSLPVYLSMLDIEMEAKQWLRARTLARYIRRQVKPDAGWTYRYAEILRWTGKFDSTLLLWQKTVKLDENHLEAHQNLGAYYFARKAYSLALPHLEKVLEQRPGHVNANLWYAHIQEYRQNNYPVAGRHYATALRYDSLNAYAAQSVRRTEWKQRRDSLRALGLWKEPEVADSTQNRETNTEE